MEEYFMFSAAGLIYEGVLLENPFFKYNLNFISSIILSHTL